MNNVSRTFPTYLKLAARDLRSNLLGTTVLVLILALAIGAALPLTAARKQAPLETRARSIAQEGQSVTWFTEDFAGDPGNQVQAFAYEYPYTGELGTAMESAGLRVLTHLTSYLALPVEADAKGDSEEVYVGGQVAYVDTSLPEFSSLIAYTSGRAPITADEVVVNELLLGTPQAAKDLVGKSFTNTAFDDGFPSSSGDIVPAEEQTLVRIVGTFTSEAFDGFVGPLEGASANTTGTELLGFGAPLSDAQALDLAHHLSAVSPVPWGNWSVRNFVGNEELAWKAAQSIPLSHDEALEIRSERPEDRLILPGLLAFIVLLSVPLYWQNRRRRATELAQLTTAGMPSSQRALSMAIPSVVVGALSAVLGFVLFRVGAPLFEKFWAINDHLAYTASTLGYTFGVALLAGIGASLLASLIPWLVGRNDYQPQNVSVGDPGEVSAVEVAQFGARKLWWPVALVVTGLVALPVSAQLRDNIYSLLFMACGLAVVVVGAYFLVAAVLPHIARILSERPIAVRLAAKEIMLQRAAAVNAAIAVSLLSGIAASFTVICRQHDLEGLRPYISHSNAALVVSSFACAIMLLVLFFVTLRSGEEVRAWRTPLVAQGFGREQFTQVDGHRALIVASLGAAFGYVAGLVAGGAVILYRAASEGYEFLPAALLPDVSTLVAVALPIGLAYLIGELAGLRNVQALPL